MIYDMKQWLFNPCARAYVLRFQILSSAILSLMSQSYLERVGKSSPGD